MNGNSQTERQRALANPNASAKAVFGMPVRTGQRSNFENGDILVFPALKLVEKEDGKHLVYADTEKDFAITEPMTGSDGAPVVRNGKPVMLTYGILDIIRGTEKATCRFFPSIFWKTRVEAIPDPANAKKFARGDRKTSIGTAVDEAHRHPTVDEMLVAFSGKKIKATVHDIKAPNFGVGREDALTDQNVSDDTWYELNFVQ